jgi:rubrerythrin
MPQFVDPFPGVTPDRKITPAELIRAVRMTLSAEEEAVHLYEAIADATDNELAKAVLHDIANEERVHAGEFQRLISILAPDEDGFLAEGAGEVNVMAAKVQGGAAPSPSASAVPTVGGLKK